MTGVDWVGTAQERLKYGEIKVNVVADATGVTETALSAWGVQAGSDGSITKKAS